MVTASRSPESDVSGHGRTFFSGVMMSDQKDLASEGLQDELKGAAKKVEGRIRGAVGGARGDTGEQVKGKAQEIKGKAQQAGGRAKQRVDPNPGVDDE
jgi:uncharacterized protein YjbJ (UPF0337 family)